MRNGYVCGVGLFSSNGFDTASVAAFVQTGLSTYQSSKIFNGDYEPLKLAPVSSDALPPLDEEVSKLRGPTSRHRRMLQLATLPMVEALAKVPETINIPVFLAGPEDLPACPSRIPPSIITHLAMQTGVKNIDLKRSLYFAQGRAGGMIALDAALKCLESGESDYALLGGVDTYYDTFVLGTLSREERVLTIDSMDGFVPGEGAGFVLLASERIRASFGGSPMTRVSAPGLANEPGYRYNPNEPYRGDGMAEAVTGALNHFGGPPIKSLMASLNGENFGAKEYGVAMTRNHANIDENAILEHPADTFGDIGGAFGPVLIGLGAFGLIKGLKQGPVLVLCASDGPYRGAACLNIA